MVAGATAIERGTAALRKQAPAILLLCAAGVTLRKVEAVMSPQHLQWLVMQLQSSVTMDVWMLGALAMLVLALVARILLGYKPTTYILDFSVFKAPVR